MHPICAAPAKRTRIAEHKAFATAFLMDTGASNLAVDAMHSAVPLALPAPHDKAINPSRTPVFAFPPQGHARQPHASMIWTAAQEKHAKTTSATPHFPLLLQRFVHRAIVAANVVQETHATTHKVAWAIVYKPVEKDDFAHKAFNARTSPQASHNASPQTDAFDHAKPITHAQAISNAQTTGASASNSPKQATSAMPNNHAAQD